MSFNHYETPKKGKEAHKFPSNLVKMDLLFPFFFFLPPNKAQKKLVSIRKEQELINYSYR